VDLIGHISSKFCELTSSQLDNIPVSVLFPILSHHLLKISSEDDLFSYISSRICSDPEYFDLFHFVRFEYLSLDCISSFLSALPNSIDRRLWKSISRRMISKIYPVSSLKSLKGAVFPLQKPSSFDGIISYLTQKHGGNVHDTGIVTLTSKSVYNTSFCTLRNFAYLAGSSYASDLIFRSKNEPGQWICWDFHEMRVHPTHYTIRSWGLKSWKIESSLDGVAWIVIDRKVNYGYFKTLSWQTASFAVWNSAECRFIRLTQTGKNQNGKDDLSLRAFEVFGTLLEWRD
jgi:hypothetical protein